jgi:predicted ATPase/DNA-binding CsgD family transcriptional regulator
MTAADTNIPVELTSFIGRGKELAEVEHLVRGRRLVTLTGVGGCGKTRLAMRVAARLVGHWPAGVWWVDLGSVTNPDLVARTVASTTGVLAEPGADPMSALARQLRSRRLLLCLDTCEHLLEVTADLTDTLLRACPEVSVLATSREPLGVPGEAIWRVPSLKENEAVRLFVDRATLVSPAFGMTAHEPAVRDVCRRLDGIPLAIELGAAWVRILSMAQIAEGLDDCFRLLTGGPRRALPRHQTLAASMLWSHDLLDDVDRMLFRRLAVFTGSFTLDAVRAVCADDEPSAHDVLAIVARLVDKSLVVVREGGVADVRYRLLDTVRQFAEERLRAAGELDLARDRHLDFFLALAEQAEPELDRDQDTWRRVLDSHQDNIFAALNWGLGSAGPSDDRGRRLAAAMARQWFIRGQAHEGLEFLHRAVERAPADRSALQGRLLSGRAMLAMVSGRLDLGADAAERGLAIATDHGDDRTRARCLVMAAWPLFFRDLSRCHALCAEAHAAGAAAGEPFARDLSQILAAYTLGTRDRHDEAVALARVAFRHSEPRGDRFCAGFALGLEMWAAALTGDLRGALRIGADALRIVEPLGDYFAYGTIATEVAIARGMAGDIDAVRRMMVPIVRSVEEAPDVDVVAFMLTLGLLDLWAGEFEAATRWFVRATGDQAPDGDDWTATRCLPGLVSALRRLGRIDEATAQAERAVTSARQVGGPWVLAQALDEQALLVTDADPARALELHHEALAVRRDAGLRTFYVDSLDALAAHAVRAGNPAHAARLLAASAAARDVMGYPRPPVGLAEVDATIAALRTALGDEFETVWAQGATLSLDDAVAAATRGRGQRNRPSIGWGSLSPTELEVVRLVLDGLSNPEIGQRLFISRTTVKTHLAHIFRKLGVANRTELAAFASGRMDDRRS